ncbi:DUF5688 family protein [Lacrimispora brassicae]
MLCVLSAQYYRNRMLRDYLNLYYMHFTHVMPLQEILVEIISAYNCRFSKSRYYYIAIQNEAILVPDNGNLGYGKLQKMVSQINQSVVPKEDVLSDSIYRYSRHECSISLIG